MNKDIKKLIRQAKQARWEVTFDGAGHLIWQPPSGGIPVRTSSTPSDWRALHSIKVKLREAGLEVPHGGYTPPKAEREDLEGLDLQEVARAGIAMNLSLGAADTVTSGLRAELIAKRMTKYNPLDDVASVSLRLDAWESNTTEDSPTLSELLKGHNNVSAFKGDLLRQVAEAAYAIVRADAEHRKSPREGSRWLYNHSIKFAILRSCRQMDITDPGDIDSYSKMVYALFREDAFGEAAALCLRAYVPAKNGAPMIDSLWSIANTWVAPNAIVPINRFVSERDKRMSYVESKLSPVEAGENRQPAPVEIIKPANPTAAKTKEPAVSVTPIKKATKSVAKTLTVREEVRAALLDLLNSDPDEATVLRAEVGQLVDSIKMLTDEKATLNRRVGDLMAALEMVNGVVNLKAVGLDTEALGLAL